MIHATEQIMNNLDRQPTRSVGVQADAAAGGPRSGPPPDQFARAAIRVICRASVTPAVGERVFERCLRALQFGSTARAAFRHPGKAGAIDTIWKERERLAEAYAGADDPLAFLDTLPGIGPTTRVRLAAELGLPVAAPELEWAAA
jgi:transposase